MRELVAELPERRRAVWCFGCARGGRIYDLASLLAAGPWGRDLRGDAFRRARDVVAGAVENPGG